MVWNKNYNVDVEDDVQTSRINAAGLINATLEKLWVESYAAMDKGKYELWNVKLDSIWCILGGDVKEGETEDKEIQAMNLKIYSHGSLKSKVGSGFEQKENPNNPIQYQLLLKKSVYLRRLQNKQGKGTAYRTPDLDDFD